MHISEGTFSHVTSHVSAGMQRNIYIYHFCSLDVEAGFYGDTGRVIGFFYVVKLQGSRLVPGWVTAVLDFVEDPVSRYISGSGGMEYSVLSVLHRLRPRICLVRRV